MYGSVLQVMTQRLAERKVTNYVQLRKKVTGSTLSEEFAAARDLPPGGEPLQPFGDLVVLLNPAFEGERYFNLKTFSEQWQYPDQQRPVLAIFSSETDRATEWVFTIGRFFSTIFERYRPGPLGDLQKTSNHRTIPWTEEFVTHTLFTTADCTRQFGRPAPEVTPWNRVNRANPRRVGDCVVTPKANNRSPWTPFYVVRVDPALMDSHTDIWRPAFTNFLEKFIGETDTKAPAKASHRMLRVWNATAEESNVADSGTTN